MDHPVSAHVLDRALHGDAHAILVTVMTLIGVAVSYFFSIQADFEGTTKALKRLFPRLSSAAIMRIDLAFVLLFGTLVAIAVCDPTNYAQALGAGIGWVGLINLSGGRSKNSNLNVGTSEADLEELRHVLRTNYKRPPQGTDEVTDNPGRN